MFYPILAIKAIHEWMIRSPPAGGCNRAKISLSGCTHFGFANAFVCQPMNSLLHEVRNFRKKVQVPGLQVCYF
jgi:hypothetical protein